LSINVFLCGGSGGITFRNQYVAADSPSNNVLANTIKPKTSNETLLNIANPAANLGAKIVC
ncbi:MAG: hypothetical protein K0U66_07135, partial [Gammaproteobacteria bacterium]|nr:hypothetical protein [Gammaproteobacteria bacterium]